MVGAGADLGLDSLGLANLHPSRLGNLWICSCHKSWWNPSPSAREGFCGGWSHGGWVWFTITICEGWWHDWEQALEFQNFSRVLAAWENPPTSLLTAVKSKGASSCLCIEREGLSWMELGFGITTPVVVPLAPPISLWLAWSCTFCSPSDGFLGRSNSRQEEGATKAGGGWRERRGHS
jgi:hypothetical protein